MTRTALRRTTAGLLTVAAATTALALAQTSTASAAVPQAWTQKTNTCQSLSLYGQNPAYNGGLTPDHQVSGHKKLYYTSGEVVNGWTPVYSAGQEDWHTQWVRGECLVDGWPYADAGTVDF